MLVQRVNPINHHKKSFNHHFPMVFLWFSYGFSCHNPSSLDEKGLSFSLVRSDSNSLTSFSNCLASEPGCHGCRCPTKTTLSWRKANNNQWKEPIFWTSNILCFCCLTYLWKEKKHSSMIYVWLRQKTLSMAMNYQRVMFAHVLKVNWKKIVILGSFFCG